MITRINARVEKVLREAIGSVPNIEADQIPATLAALDDKERAEVLALAGIVTSYVAIDVCDAKWPNHANIRQIADDLATTGTTAQRLHLDAGAIYAYLYRTVFGSDPLEDVISDEPEFTRLPVIVAQRALAVYHPKGLDVWDYLDRIESAIEVAEALDPAVLPAAVQRAYMPTLAAERQEPRA